MTASSAERDFSKVNLVAVDWEYKFAWSVFEITQSVGTEAKRKKGNW